MHTSEIDKTGRNKIYLVLFIIILLIGAFFRFYRIREYMIFLGDEGRDVLVVKRMLIDHKFTLLGPITSVGSMYDGPIYYYFMTPFLWLWQYDPVGPAIMVALFSVATIFLIYHITSKYYSSKAALIASFLYAISPLTIIQGRSSWNPNIVPFFSLLTIFGLTKTIIEKKPGYLFLTGLAFGICVELHYISLLLAPVILVSLILFKIKVPLKYYLYLLLGFLIAVSPFLAFEVRHSFTNTRTVMLFLSQTGNKQTIGFSNFLFIISDVLVRLFWRLVVIKSAEITKLFILALFAVVSFFYFKSKTRKPLTGILLIWFILGLIAYGLYKGVIYDYYFVPLFSLPFILTGIFIDNILGIKRIGYILGIIILVILSYFNLVKSPLLQSPNNLLQNTQNISSFLFSKVDHEPYNFALIAGKNSDHAYRYFLELWGNPPVTIENPTVDPERKTITNVLYVICEDKICQPLGNPLWEIAGFGRAEIAEEWNVSTVKVFKLVHYQENINKTT